MKLLTPDRYVHDVTTVDLRDLRKQGKRALLLDRDNTIVPRDTGVIPPAVAHWVEEAHGLGFRLCFVSNNWAKNVRPDAERLGITLVTRAAKPLPFALWHALRRLRVKRSEAVLLGDQLFTDVLGGRLAGITTILVEPQSTVELEHSLALRNWEARVLKDLVPEMPPAPNSPLNPTSKP